MVNGNAPTPLLTVFIGSSATSVTHQCQALPDTGATRSVVSFQLLQDAGLTASIEPLPRSIRLRAANGSVVPLDGHILLFISSGTKLIRADALVTSYVKEKLFISWHDLRELAVIPRDFPLSSCAYLSILDSDSCTSGTPSAVLDSAMEVIKKDFSDVLGDKLEFDTGMACPPMKIHMRDDLTVKPINVKVARQVPLHLRDMANKVVSDLVDAKRITRVTVPTDWCSPAHFVPKPCGKKVRLVTDYRVLNNAVRRPVHPFPSATDLMKRIAPDSRFFCKLDAIHGYYQVPLDEELSLIHI